MKDIVIVGAGGFGKEVKTIIDSLNDIKQEWNLLGFFDDNLAKGELVNNLPVLGTIADLNRYSASLNVVLAVGMGSIREEVFDRLDNSKLQYPVIKHPTVQIGDVARVKLGRGTVITAGVIITVDVEVGEFVILNLNTTIGHDTSIGDFASLMPGVNVAGNVQIGDGTFVGSGVNILNNVNIGELSLVGAGSLVNHDLPPNCKAIGVPARVFKIKD